MISADLAFQKSANAAAAMYRAAPAYISYRAQVHVSVPALHRERDVNRFVQVRVRDDTAVLQDLPRGRRQLGHAFPLIPTFDALSYFRLQGRGGLRTAIESYVQNVDPLTYGEPTPSQPRVDVLVVNLKYYVARYAPDSGSDDGTPGHLTLSPLPVILGKGELYFKDLYFDNRTYLPTRIVFDGPDDRLFSVDYALLENHWLVNRLSYEETEYPPLKIARLHVKVNAVLDQFTFPSSPPDRQLAP